MGGPQGKSFHLTEGGMVLSWRLVRSEAGAFPGPGVAWRGKWIHHSRSISPRPRENRECAMSRPFRRPLGSMRYLCKRPCEKGVRDVKPLQVASCDSRTTGPSSVRESGSWPGHTMGLSWGGGWAEAGWASVQQSVVLGEEKWGEWAGWPAPASQRVLSGPQGGRIPQVLTSL